MQEIEVPPRDIFQHYVYVDQKGKNLLWYFSTKRKNISFGLYYRKEPVTSSSDLFIASSTTSVNSLKHGHRSNSGTIPVANSTALDNADCEIGDDSTSLLSLHDSQNPAPIRKSSIFMDLKDPNLVEIIPVGHYESSKSTIKGSYLVQEPGTYVLCFDNSFSRNTSKILTFFVGLKDGPEEKKNEPEMSGWLLKKKRKKIQGWAKIWVQIDKGVLSYFKNPQSFCCGSIQIPLSVIYVVPSHRIINIDSGSCLYSLRALNTEDFDQWMKVIQKYSKDKPSGDSLSNDTSNLARSATKGLRVSTLRQGTNSSEPSPSYSKGKEVYNSLLSQFSEARVCIDSLKQAVMSPTSSPEGSTDKSGPTPSTTLGLIERLENCLMNMNLRASSLSQMLFDESSKNTTLTNTIANLTQDNQNLKENLGIAGDSGSCVSGGQQNSRPVSIASSAATGEDEFYDAPEIIISEDVSGDDQLCVEEDDDDDDDDDDTSFFEAFSPPDPKDSAVIHLNNLRDPSQIVPRRRALPSPVSGPDISIMSILRKNIGKDLSSVAMPVGLNEPLNLLQRLCEELEYSELLDKASDASDSIDRLAYVAAFALSAYSSTQARTGRKPFNPLLGETYECVRPNKGFRFISEKVSHHPPIMACYAESANYKFWQDSTIKSKFWGKSMEMVPEGTVHVELSKHNEHYTYTKPSTWVRNMLAGTRYLEHSGDVRITNHTTNEYCILTFKEGGFFKSSNNQVQAVLHDAQGRVVRTYSGQWDQAFWSELGGNKLVIWHAHPPLPNAADSYGFTQFAIELNEITPDIVDKLPRTDTRYRPDQRLFELGKVDEADEEKLRLEQLQRERRKQMEIAGEVWTPQWFEKKPDPYSPGQESWVYSGGYWEARTTGIPPSKVELW